MAAFDESMRTPGVPVDEMNLVVPVPVWSDQFALGHPQMDATHEEFLALLAKVLAADDSQMLDAVQELFRHTQGHFAQEDRWMEESAFPPRQCHMDEHAAVLQSLEDVLAIVAIGEPSEGRRIGQALAAWFPRHADYLDSALSHWLCKCKFDARPVVFKRHLRHLDSASPKDSAA